VESSADAIASSSKVRIAMVAGEVSGDNLGAGLIQALQKKIPSAEFVGIAGPKMQALGCKSLYSMDELTVMGILVSLVSIVRILWIRYRLYRYLVKNPPDVFVGIDAPDFNLSLEAKLRKKGITCIHYVSPTVWAWRRYRLRKIKRAVDHMLAILPFEEDFYREYNIPVTYVGHPMAEEIELHPDVQAARKRLDLPEDKVIVALLPGSRRSELERHGALFVETVRWIHERNRKLHFVVAPVDSATQQQFETAIAEQHGKNLPIEIITGKSREVMTASDLVVLASGTAALEAALLKKPMVVTYKVSFLTYVIVKLLSHVKYYSMPNNLAGRELVPELMQYEATAENIGRAVEKILSDPVEKKHLVAELEKMHLDLKRDGDQRAADTVLSYLKVTQ
jgi:lipid-A-disaccharide synthase